MFYVYFLKKPKFKYVYIGFTDDLQRRMREHKKDKPGYKLVYYEAYLSKKDARERERKLKQREQTIRRLKERLKDSFK